jgi:putative ABC transport system permease protein
LIPQLINGQESQEVFLHPLHKWHLYSYFENGKQSGGEIETVRLFALIAAFILLVACINFMNLSTAQSEKRAREVGVRKVAGATKTALVAQFFGESMLLVLLSGILAIFVVRFSLPSFNLLVGKQLFIPFHKISFWLSSMSFVVVTGLHRCLRGNLKK